MKLFEIVREIEENLNQIGGLKNIKVHVIDTTGDIQYKLADEKYQQIYTEMCCRLKDSIKNNNPYISVTCIPDENCINKSTNLLRRIKIGVYDKITNHEKREEVLLKAALNFNGILKRLRKYDLKK